MVCQDRPERSRHVHPSIARRTGPAPSARGSSRTAPAARSGPGGWRRTWAWRTFPAPPGSVQPGAGVGEQEGSVGGPSAKFTSSACGVSSTAPVAITWANLVRGDHAPGSVDAPAVGSVGMALEGTLRLGVEGGGVDEASHPSGEARGVGGAARRGDRQGDLGIEVRAAVERQIGLIGGRHQSGRHRVDEDHVREARGPVVVLGCLVGGGGDHGGPVAVGVFDGLAGERGVVERPHAPAPRRPPCRSRRASPARTGCRRR